MINTPCKLNHDDYDIIGMLKKIVDFVSIKNNELCINGQSIVNNLYIAPFVIQPKDEDRIAPFLSQCGFCEHSSKRTEAKECKDCNYFSEALKAKQCLPNLIGELRISVDGCFNFSFKVKE